MKQHRFDGQERLLLVMFLFLVASGIWSSLRPFNFMIWWTEAIFPLFAMVVLLATYRRFRFTTLTYSLIFILCLFFFIGSHYSFTGLPLLNIVIAQGQKRSLFDYICHFWTGLTIAFVAGELFAARARYTSRAYFTITVSALVMALAAVWELVEWVACLATGDAYDMFKGVRWDTYWDMFCSLLGLLVALPFISRRSGNQS